MIVHVDDGNGPLRFDLSRGVDLTALTVPNGDQPAAFGLPAATATPFRAGDFVGDTRLGGPVNCAVLSVAPHGDGTHAESAAHVSHGAPTVEDAVGITHLVATIVTVPLTRLADCGDRSAAARTPDELVVSRASITAAVARAGGFRQALIIRHAPGESLDTRDWSGAEPPYPTDDAMDLLASSGTRALLIDLPSVDREMDEGRLRNHRVWWGLPETGHDAEPTHPERFIVEMIAVPHSLADGACLVAVAVPRIRLDALPCRVVAYPQSGASEST